MEKVWLKQYPQGIPAEIDLDEFASLKDLLERTCRRFGDLPAYRNMGVSITYDELDRFSRDFGAFLQKVSGLTKGDRVAIMLPNLLQYPVALFGALRAGLTVVNVNPMYTARELQHQLADSGAKAIVVLENFAHTLQEVLPRTRVGTVVTTRVGDLLPMLRAFFTNLVVKYVKKMVPEWRIADTIPFRAVLKAGRERGLDDVPIAHDDVAFLQYTGGTTGMAKGAILTHRNAIANLQQLSAWFPQLEEGVEIAVMPLPLYHIYALTATFSFTKLGAQVVLITNPRDIPALISELKKTGFSAVIGINTLYNALLNAPGFADVPTGRIKLACAGGMATQRAVAERWKAATGVPIIEGLGLTETSGVVTCNPTDIEDWTGNIGVPIPSTEAAILDDQGRELPVGEVGEIGIRGPQVMKGYWNRPDDTAMAFAPDGWFRTGDMGSMDAEGRIKITDRRKDMIIVSGFKVFPNEVEDVVMMHPGVLEVAAIGVPDPRSGEAVKIVVVKKDPALTEASLLEHCRKSLVAYKAPKTVEFRTEPLPKTPIGKILRRMLRTEVPVAA